MNKNLLINLIILVSLFLFNASETLAANKIESSKAAFHIGEDLMVCGVVAKVANLKGRTILNMGKPYPNEDIGILIWDSNVNQIEGRIGSLSLLQSKRICVSGTIEVYKEHLQIKISNPMMIRIIK